MSRQEQIISNTRRFVKHELGQDSSGHDWYHIERVSNLAFKMAIKEGANPFICEMAALLHDLIDEKLFASTEQAKQKVIAWLEKEQVERNEMNHIMEIISTLSFSGGQNPPMRSIEGKVVQDADRLDALGAIGIARTFAYAGWKGDLMFDPELPPRENMNKEEYRKGKSTALNHFHEKLYKLKFLMNTKFGKRIAEQREQVMKQFEDQFHREWNGVEEE